MEHRAVGVRLSIMMFLQFFIWGCWYVTMSTFINSSGWDSDVIGDAYSVGPLAAIISPLFLGMVADRFFATQKVLGAMHLLGGVVMFLVPLTASGDEPSSTWFLVLLLAYMLCYMPTLGLTNTLAFHNIKDQQKQFPIIRMFGTIGWIVAGFVVSKLLHADDRPLPFYVAGAASILLGVYSLTLPHTPPPMAGRKATVTDLLGFRSLWLLKDRAFLVFITSSFLICIPLAAYYNFGNLFVQDMGFEDPAANMIWGQVGEVFFMLLMPLMFVRLGVKWMLAVGMLAWVLRYALFGFGAPDQVAWMVMGGILLHGICYDFFFVTGQIYVDQRASKEIRGQAQGFLVLMTQGVGLLIGAQLFARIVGANTVDGVREWPRIWMFPAVGAVVVLLAFTALFRERAASRPADAA